MCLHTGGVETDLSAIGAVPTPAATESWFPIAHLDFINRVKAGLVNANLEIVTESHALAKEGNRYFGLMQIGHAGVKSDDYGLVLGLRNSHDKVFPTGLVAGAGVFVCDNLSFSGEVKELRKHTKNLFLDLPGKISSAVGKLGQLWVSQDTRFTAYKGTALNDSRDVHDLLIRALDNKAATVTQIKHILNEWRTPTHEDFAPRTVWSLFNAFTEIAKGNLQELPARTMALHGLLDGYCGILTKEDKAIDLEIV